MDEKLRVSLRKVEAYEKIINVIDSSKTENHYKVCYAMIDLFDGLFQDSSLTEQLTNIADSKLRELV
jgi:DeoR/GlpR family transcriptional regulator of sugar metabolism